MAVVVTGWKAGGMPLGTVDVDQSAPVDKPEYAGLKQFVKSNAKQEFGPYVYFSSPTPITAPATPKLTEDALRVVKDKALAYVNVARTALGCRPLFDLPKGYTGNAADCVIARAIPGAMKVGGTMSFVDTRTTRIVGNAWRAQSVDKTIVTPVALCTFINCFDARHYPELAL